MPRVFFALCPDDNVRLRVARHAIELAREANGKATRADSLHLTLSFLGDVEEAREPDLFQAAAQVFARPFNFALDRMACFPRGKVSWLGSTAPPQELFDLQSSLQAELRSMDFPVDMRPFMPHVTLARNIQNNVPVRDVEPILWAAREFCLVTSNTEPTGAIYTVTQRWKL